MTTWSLYDLKTGDLVGTQISGPDEGFIEVNTPEGFGAILGRHDHITKCVVDGEVVDRAEPLVVPGADEYITKQQIIALEAEQARPMRELLIDPDNETARTKLQSIDEQIGGLRTSMDRNKPTPPSEPTL